MKLEARAHQWLPNSKRVRMTRERRFKPPKGHTFTEAQLREFSRPVALPALPWRYTLSPHLVTTLISIADAAGQMRAAPISYFRRKELEARAKRTRILWTVGHQSSTVRREEVDAVLGGARLNEDRRSTAEYIRRAAVVEDALAQYTRGLPRERLTPELALAYKRAGEATPGLNTDRWISLNGRQRAKLLEANREGVKVPAAVRMLFAWADEDKLVSQSAVLRAATLFWGLTLLFRPWPSVAIVLHHELRVGGVDADGLLILTEATEAQRDLMTTPLSAVADADDGDLTKYFERFAWSLSVVLGERLRELGRAQDDEEHLPWKIVTPPDALDARLYETVEKLGQVGSAAILSVLGTEAPPLRTVQRRLQKLVRDAVLRKRGGRKNAIYTLAVHEQSD